jgi:hypothetical protein
MSKKITEEENVYDRNWKPTIKKIVHPSHDS